VADAAAESGGDDIDGAAQTLADDVDAEAAMRELAELRAEALRRMKGQGGSRDEDAAAERAQAAVQSAPQPATPRTHAGSAAEPGSSRRSSSGSSGAASYVRSDRLRDSRRTDPVDQGAARGPEAQVPVGSAEDEVVVAGSRGSGGIADFLERDSLGDSNESDAQESSTVAGRKGSGDAGSSAAAQTQDVKPAWPAPTPADRSARADDLDAIASSTAAQEVQEAGSKTASCLGWDDSDDAEDGSGARRASDSSAFATADETGQVQRPVPRPRFEPEPAEAVPEGPPLGQDTLAMFFQSSAEDDVAEVKRELKQRKAAEEAAARAEAAAAAEEDAAWEKAARRATGEEGEEEEDAALDRIIDMEALHDENVAEKDSSDEVGHKGMTLLDDLAGGEALPDLPIAESDQEEDREGESDEDEDSGSDVNADRAAAPVSELDEIASESLKPPKTELEEMAEIEPELVAAVQKAARDAAVSALGSEETLVRLQAAAADAAARPRELTAEERERKRRSKALMTILKAKPEALEALIQQHASDIDRPMLDMLHKRIMLAAEADEARSPSCAYLPAPVLRLLDGHARCNR
jgi:hypothetical protein